MDHDARRLGRAGPLTHTAADAALTHFDPPPPRDPQCLVADGTVADADSTVLAGTRVAAETSFEIDHGRSHVDLADPTDQLKRSGRADIHAGEVVTDDTGRLASDDVWQAVRETLFQLDAVGGARLDAFAAPAARFGQLSFRQGSGRA